MMPGTTVAIKHARMLTPVVHPKMMIGTLGGIRVPKMEEQVTSEVEKPREYPSFPVRGS